MRAANGLMRCPICRDVVAAKQDALARHFGRHSLIALLRYMWAESRAVCVALIFALVALEVGILAVAWQAIVSGR